MASVILDHTPAEVVRAALIQLGLGTHGIAYGAWPVFTEMEPDAPDNTITLYDTDGIVQARNMVDGEVYENHGVMIRVRGVKTIVGTLPVSGARIARNKIDDIVRALDQSVCRYSISVPDNIVSGTTLYTLHSANRSSGVMRSGRQRGNSERYVYTVNYLMSLTQD